MFNDSIHINCNIKTLNSAPDTLRTWHAVSLAPQMSADNADHAYRLVHGRRLFRWFRSLKVIAAQRLPFDLLEKYRTRMIRHFPAEHCQMVNTPGNYHINTQARLKTVSRSQLPILYSASAFEGTVIDLDPPSCCVPLHTLLRILKIFYFSGSQQHPIDRGLRWFAFRNIRPRKLKT